MVINFCFVYNKIKMSLLKSIPDTELTEYVLKLLHTHRIFTITDFLKEDSIKLSKITNLSLNEISLGKNKILKQFCPVKDNVFKMNEKLKKSTAFITGIKNLDLMLDCEVIYGSLIEICGLSASGKTILTSTIAVNLAKQFNYESLIIDTKKDFSSTNIRNFLLARNCLEKEIVDVMQKIRVERDYSLTGTLNILKLLLKKEELRAKLKLIVIDSLPSTWFHHLAEKASEGNSLLVEIANTLRKIAVQWEIVILVVNIVTRWLDYELDDDASVKSHTIIKPSLGKYWETVPALRLLMEEPASIWGEFSQNIEGSCNLRRCHSGRLIKIIKSNGCETGKCCSVSLTKQGVV